MESPFLSYLYHILSLLYTRGNRPLFSDFFHRDITSVIWFCQIDMTQVYHHRKRLSTLFVAADSSSQRILLNLCLRINAEKKRRRYQIFIWDFVADTIMGNLMDWFYGQLVGFLGNFFAIMGMMGVELFELTWVQSVVTFFSQLGWALFGVSVVVCCFEFGLDYSTGRGNIQQTAMNIVKGFLAASLFSTVPVRLYELSVTLQGQFTAEITGLGTSIGEVGRQIMEDFAAVTSLSDMTGAPDFMTSMLTSPIMLIFCVIAMGYAVIKIFFANLKRGGILLIQIAVGSLYMFSVPRGYSDGFLQWMKQVIGLCLTAFLQATILTAGLLAFREHLLLGLGLMLSAGEVPRIAGTFGLDTTTRANIMSAVYTAQAAVNTTKAVAAAIK